jgi:hypothetical protein
LVSEDDELLFMRAGGKAMGAFKENPGIWLKKYQIEVRALGVCLIVVGLFSGLIFTNGAGIVDSSSVDLMRKFMRALFN